MPPFLAPGISGAGPLALGSRAAPAVSTLPPVPLVPPAPPLLAAGAPQAATKPREAAAPTVRTLVQRIVVCSLCACPGALPRTSGDRDPVGSAAAGGVERVADRVAEQAQGEDEERQADDRRPEPQGVRGEEVLRVGDGATPRRGGLDETGTEVAQRRLVGDVGRDGDRGGDDDRTDEVGQDLAEEDRAGRHTDGAGRLDELTLAQALDLTTHEACQTHPSEDDEDDDEHPEADR